MLVVVLMAGFTTVLDATIVNIAVPHMEKSLDAPFDTMLWVINGYNLAFVMLLMTSGRLGDIFGPRKMFLIGLAMFTAASAACGLAQDANLLIILRVVQGVGGGLFNPQLLVLVRQFFPEERQNTAFGLWGGVNGLGFAAGPTVGGLLTNIDWHLIFLFNVPVGILGLLGAYFLLPEFRSRLKEYLDPPGVLVGAGAIFVGTFAFIEAQEFNWGPISQFGAFEVGPTRWSLISIYSLLLYSSVLLVAFVWVESRVKHPVAPLSLFSKPGFSGGIAAVIAVSFCTVAIGLLVSILLQSVLGFSPLHAGLVLLAQAIALMIVAPLAGRVADRLGSRRIVGFGLACIIVTSVVILMTVSSSMAAWILVPPLIALGIGYACLTAGIVPLTLGQVSGSQVGSASGLLNTNWFLGGLLGPVIVGAVLSVGVADDLGVEASHVAERLPAGLRSGFVDAWRAASHRAQSFGPHQTEGEILPRHTPSHLVRHVVALNHDVFTSAIVLGMRTAMIIVLIVAILGFIAVILSQPRNQSGGALSS